MKSIDTVSDAIAEMGGTNAVAERYDVTTAAVRNWRVTNRFPLYLHECLQADAEAIEIEINPELFRYERRKKVGRAA